MNEQLDQRAQERRRYHRYDASNISIALIPDQDSTINKTMNIVDFNRYGIALYSEHSFKVGDIISLAVTDDAGHDVKVEGFVCNRTPSKDGFRCGLRFIETSASGKAQTTTLCEMEEALERLAS